MEIKRLHLFQGYGIELEYMIVNKETLKVKPIADKLLMKAGGAYSDFVNGAVTWSNELVLHVIELKCTDPTADLRALASEFKKNVQQINSLLEEWDCILMPGGTHPFMDPVKDTHLWPHEYSEIYRKYDEIFNCYRHGWANVQSTHLNLPFYDDEEFARLHAAIRLVLPIIPAMTASSPIVEGEYNGFADERLNFYGYNQSRIPVIAGQIIPERVFSSYGYRKNIYEPIRKEIARYDTENVLQARWLNSRGAIARFDRGSVEIRLADIQENPSADLAVAAFVIALVKWLVEHQKNNLHEQQMWSTERLKEIFDGVIKSADQAVITDARYLKIWGCDEEKMRAGDFMDHLLKMMIRHYPDDIDDWKEQLQFIISNGTLSRRIVTALGGVYTEGNMQLVYRELCDCLQNNEMMQIWVSQK